MNWYCIHTKALKEQQVAGYFRERLALETYFPRLKQNKTVRRVFRTVVSPLFPRYLFCRLDISTQYRAIRYAPEVLDIVSFGGQPAIVSDVLIEGLQGWAGDVMDLTSLQPELRAGDQVQIVDGPMRGLSAVVLQGRKGSARVAVLLSILECGVQLVVNRSQLAFINQGSSHLPAAPSQSAFAS